MIQNILTHTFLTTLRAAIVIIGLAACSHNKPTEVSKTTTAVTTNEKNSVVDIHTRHSFRPSRWNLKRR